MASMAELSACAPGSAGGVPAALFRTVLGHFPTTRCPAQSAVAVCEIDIGVPLASSAT